jgi:transposase-like protein
MRKVNRKFANLIEDYKCGKFTYADLARRHGISLATVFNWIRRSGLPRHGRGRRPLTEPTPNHQHILRLVREMGVSKTAKVVGVTKQRVHNVVTRWAPGLKGPRRSKKAMTHVPRQRRPRKQIVVSFRLSTEEWDRLASAIPKVTARKWSSGKQARAFVLQRIAGLNPTHTTSSDVSALVPTADAGISDGEPPQAHGECNHERMLAPG